jgi:hypothetical protein
MIDLIGLLADGDIDETEAEAMLQGRIEAWRQGTTTSYCDDLGITADECKAYLHGAALSELARWRGNWPTECCRCGEALDLRTQKWVFTSATGGPALRHLMCRGQANIKPSH